MGYTLVLPQDWPKESDERMLLPAAEIERRHKQGEELELLLSGQCRQRWLRKWLSKGGWHRRRQLWRSRSLASDSKQVLHALQGGLDA